MIKKSSYSSKQSDIMLKQTYLDVVMAIDEACIKQSMLVKELIENKINKGDL